MRPVFSTVANRADADADDDVCVVPILLEREGDAFTPNASVFPSVRARSSSDGENLSMVLGFISSVDCLLTLALCYNILWLGFGLMLSFCSLDRIG